MGPESGCSVDSELCYFAATYVTVSQSVGVIMNHEAQDHLMRSSTTLSSKCKMAMTALGPYRVV
jgi:hypothetical protein